jgi:hypothetical protein
MWGYLVSKSGAKFWILVCGDFHPAFLSVFPVVSILTATDSPVFTICCRESNELAYPQGMDR